MNAKMIKVVKRCKKCGIGNMEVNEHCKFASNPPKYLHRCSNCGATEFLREKYPYNKICEGRYLSPSGNLIAIEGLDGSGKATQSDLLVKRLIANHIDAKKVSFPDYESQSSALVKMYLNGEISKNTFDVNPYAASSFYAADRYISYSKNWREDYLKGLTIVADRYIGSNIIHQLVKLNESKWDDFIDWLIDYECNKLKLPRPSTTIFLNMDIDISQALINNRCNENKSKKDIHEGNVKYLRSCHKAAMYAIRKLGWKEIKCYEGSRPLSYKKIAADVFDVVKENI